MAFESIVVKQIKRLKEPSLSCVDKVVTELTQVVRKCGEKASFFLIFISFSLLNPYINLSSANVHSSKK